MLRREAGAVAVGRICARCASTEHGRPVVRVASGDAPHVSLAYARGLAVVAWGHHGPVGVDVEAEGPAVPGVGERADWTRVEALLKATGEGLAREPDGLRDLGAATLPTVPLDLPAGWVGTLAGRGARWRAVR